ncbi:MAG: hypothetical protein QNJ53_15745 [Pleurocapsa sp. MO_192.B19]|nr:hypothetical protein [Pleurocapsa sp. MO_192.B19]
MTTIVKHKRTGNVYILLGINGEIDKANPSRFLSELFAQEKSDVSCSATVCDFQGNIFLAYIDDLIVIEIDGKKPADILPEPTNFTVGSNVSNDGYHQQADNFEDEFEEDLAKSPHRSTDSPDSPADSIDSQSKSEPSNYDDDDDDWI